MAAPSTGGCKQTCWALPRWARVGMEEALGCSLCALSSGNTVSTWICLLKPKFRDPENPRESLAEFGSSDSFGRDARLQLWGGLLVNSSTSPLLALRPV